MKRNSLLIALLVLAAIVCAVLITIDVTKNNQEPQIVYVTPEVTAAPEITPQIVYVTAEPTEVPPEVTPVIIYVTPEPTSVPTVAPTQEIRYIYITPEPTATAEATPEVIYVPVTETPTPTQEPTPGTPTPIIVFYYTATPAPAINVTPTSIPTSIPTMVIVTATPAPIITATPVPTASPVPIITATPIPTAIPTAIVTATPVPTATPTPMITEAPTAPPTQSPEESNRKIKTIMGELKKAQVSGEVIPMFDEPQVRNDFSKYVDLSGIDHYMLFTELRPFFVNVIAHSFNFDFKTGSSPETNLENSLKSGRGSDGRLILYYDKSGNNAAIMDEILCGVTDYEKANRIMLSFITENTAGTPDNSNERLFICSND